MERVIVIGTSCSGKTTFADNLAAKLNCGRIELDALNWLPDWQERSHEEFRALAREAVVAEQWVMDGNYTRLRDITWSRATTLIWLNYPLSTVIRQWFQRTWQRAYHKEELFGGNYETFRRAFFSRDSLLIWILKTYHSVRARYRIIFDENQYEALEKIEFRHPRQAQAFLDTLPIAPAPNRDAA